MKKLQTTKAKKPPLKKKGLIIRLNGVDMSKAFLNKGLAFHIRFKAGSQTINA